MTETSQASTCGAPAPKGNVPHGASWKKLLLTPWTITLGIPVVVLLLDPANAAGVVAVALKAFGGTARYIMLAVLLIAWLKASGAEAMIANAFRGREVRMIFLAALFGGLAPFCSCEVIPFIAGLLALGAPLSAVMAFWLSSPLIDPPTLIITAGALGWEFALGKAFFAVALGLLGGFAVRLLMKGGVFSAPLRPRPGTSCGCGPSVSDDRTVWKFWREERRREVFRQEFVANALFLIKWLAFAYMVQALLVFYVPASLIASLVGGQGITPIISAAAIGMPAYLNGYAAPALLSGLLEQGMSVGAAMSFMIAGSVSSIPAMTAVWSLVKKRVFFTYLALGFSGAVASGALFQQVFQLA